MSDAPNPMTSELARQLVARRRVSERRCKVCGAPFRGIATRLYCGTTCTMRAYRGRKAVEREQRRQETSS